MRLRSQCAAANHYNPVGAPLLARWLAYRKRPGVAYDESRYLKALERRGSPRLDDVVNIFQYFAGIQSYQATRIADATGGISPVQLRQYGYLCDLPGSPVFDACNGKVAAKNYNNRWECRKSDIALADHQQRRRRMQCPKCANSLLNTARVSRSRHMQWTIPKPTVQANGNGLVKGGC